MAQQSQHPLQLCRLNLNQQQTAILVTEQQITLQQPALSAVTDIPIGAIAGQAGRPSAHKQYQSTTYDEA